MAKRTWTTEEEQWIIDNRPATTALVMSEHFGITYENMRKKIFDLQKKVGTELMPSKQKQPDPVGAIKQFFRRGQWRDYIKEEDRYHLLDPHRRSTRPLKPLAPKREETTQKEKGKPKGKKRKTKAFFF